MWEMAGKRRGLEATFEIWRWLKDFHVCVKTMMFEQGKHLLQEGILLTLPLSARSQGRISQMLPRSTQMSHV